MEEEYLDIIKEVMEKGILSLEKRKQIWSNYGNGVFEDVKSAQRMRIQLAVECLKKIMEECNNILPVLRKSVENIIKLIEKEEKISKNNLEEFYSFCEEEIDKTDNFCVGYLQQAIKHLIKIVETDEPLIKPNYKLVDNDDELEIEETDTAYCSCVIWKYQDVKKLNADRRNMEVLFWIWYIKKAAEIQGISIEHELDLTGFTSEEKHHNKVDSLSDLVKQICCDYEYVGCGKKNKTIVLQVLNLNDNPICPNCGEKSERFKDFYGNLNIGKIKEWKIQLDIKEHLYYCDNPQCEKINFIPKEKIDYKEKVSNFVHIKENPANEEKIRDLLANI